MINENIKKNIAQSLILIIFAGPVLGAIAVPSRTHAFVSTGEPSKLTGVDLSRNADEILESAIDKSLDRANSALAQELSEVISEETTIGDFGRYTDALVEGKALASSLEKTFDNADPSSAGTNCEWGDIICMAHRFESSPVITGQFSITPEEAAQVYLQSSEGLRQQYIEAQAIADLAQREARLAQIERQIEGPIQNVLMGATTLLTSSIACGGINSTALRNAANYLAVATSGVLSNEIQSSLGLNYYQQMGRLGSPNANSNYWPLVFQDLAMQHEGKARMSAALEVLSPGVKSSQNIPSASNPNNPPVRRPGERPGYNTTEVLRTVNSMTIGQQQSWDSFAGALKSFGTQSALNFIAYDALILAQISAHHIANLISKIPFIGGLFEKLGTVGQALIVKGAASVTASFVSTFLIQGLVKKLHAKIASTLLQGRVFGESNGCRQRSSTTDLAGAFDANSVNIPGISDSASDLVFFSVLPDRLEAPQDISAGVHIEWDARALATDIEEPNVIVSLSPLPVGCGPALGASGSCLDTPQTTTTYTLTASGPNGTVSVSRTVVIQPIQPITDSQVEFDVTPISGTAPLVVTVTWSIPSGVPVESFIIDPLGALVQSASGSVEFTLNESMTFNLILVNLDGSVVQRSVSVDVAPGSVLLPPPPPSAVSGAFTDRGGFGVRE